MLYRTHLVFKGLKRDLLFQSLPQLSLVLCGGFISLQKCIKLTMITLILFHHVTTKWWIKWRGLSSELQHHVACCLIRTYHLSLLCGRVSKARDQHEAGSKQNCFVLFSFTRLHSVISQKIELFILTSVRTSNPICVEMFRSGPVISVCVLNIP
jgi:hypothetical protein